MAHLVRVQPDATWVRGYVTVGTDLRDIDRNTFVAINGDDGGSWTPTADITIGGKGIILAGPAIMSNVAGGNSRVNVSGDAAPLIFGRGAADDVFGYASPLVYDLPTGLCEHYALLNESAGAVLDYAANQAGIRTTAPGARFCCELRVYNGSDVSQFVLSWRVGETHANAPNPPRMRVYAVDANGNILPLRSAGADTDADGFVNIVPSALCATGTLYTQALGQRGLIYACDQNTRIDLSKYSYFVEFIEEVGPYAFVTTGNYFCSVTGRFTVLGYDGQN